MRPDVKCIIHIHTSATAAVSMPRSYFNWVFVFYLYIKAAALQLKNMSKWKAACHMPGWFRYRAPVMYFYHLFSSLAVNCRAHCKHRYKTLVLFVPKRKKRKEKKNSASVEDARASQSRLFSSHANRCPRWNVESCPFPRRLCCWETWAASVTMAAWIIKRRRWSFRKRWARLPRYRQTEAPH